MRWSLCRLLIIIGQSSWYLNNMMDQLSYWGLTGVLILALAILSASSTQSPDPALLMLVEPSSPLPGELITVTLIVRNPGLESWAISSFRVLINGSDFSEELPIDEEIPLPPGSERIISLELEAPGKPGLYLVRSDVCLWRPGAVLLLQDSVEVRVG